MDGTKKKVGFAAMNYEKRIEIARKGGQSVPIEKRSFFNNHDLAVSAGRKGGKNVPANKRSFSRNSDLAAVAGRKGGLSSNNKREGQMKSV